MARNRKDMIPVKLLRRHGSCLRKSLLNMVGARNEIYDMG